MTAFSRGTRGLLTTTLLLTAPLLSSCGSSAAPDSPEELLDGKSAFVAISREQESDVGSVGQALGNPGAFTPGSSNGFYVAVRKDSLKERWFLSAYAKSLSTELYKYVISDFTLGTRVVSFQEQNGKLFVFDTSDQFKVSELDDPRILVEAWPIVNDPRFDRMKNSDKYVLVDPSAGLNDFAITGETFADPSLAYGGAYPVRVGVAFMQNFRELDDGATFEEVFTGDVFDGHQSASAWGTLGLSLRRYAEGDGFTPTPLPATPYYFSSDARFVPNGSGAIESNAVKFNVHPGMKPIEVRITEGAFRAQADFPDVDVLGAFQRGVEGWNEAFGFPVFKATFVHSDTVPDDDTNPLLVDYPGGYPFSFADWRHNPNTGEIRGMSIYFSGAFFDNFQYFSDDPAPATARPARPVVPTLAWGGAPAHRPACIRWSSAFNAGLKGNRGSEVERTVQEKSALYIQHVVAHEVGHTLGLRHNFAGSLEPPSSSVMDYLDDFTDSLEVAAPGPYDRAAIDYLYGASSDLPTAHPFCTDKHLSQSATCQQSDSGADPLRDFWTPSYQYLESLILDLGYGVDLLDAFYLNELLEFARDPNATPEDRTLALQVALGRTAVPISAQDAADPYIPPTIDRVAEIILRRIALDPAEQRGFLSSDLSAPEAIDYLALQTGRMLRNEDGIRSFRLRRTAVDVLKSLQAGSALVELQTSRNFLAASLTGGGLAAEDVPLVEDLIARIEANTKPYFD